MCEFASFPLCSLIQNSQQNAVKYIRWMQKDSILKFEHEHCQKLDFRAMKQPY